MRRTLKNFEPGAEKPDGAKSQAERLSLWILSFLTLAAFSSGCHAIAVAEHKAIPMPLNASGKQLFQAHCIKCHSENPTSIFPKITDKVALPLEDPARMNLFPREYLTKIITEGGTSVGRSRVMPRWDEVFSDQEISRIVDYLTGKEDASPEES